MPVVTPFDPWHSELCSCPSKYSVSPYTGCSHACLYCYISAYIPNPFYCRLKQDFTSQLERDLRKVDPRIVISMANSSDPYPPIEREVGVTRKAMKILLDAGFKVQLVTKSDLVVRDLDLIKDGKCCVSFSITTLRDEIASKIEPGAPPPSSRIKALKRLADSGVPCCVRIDPIIHGLNDEEAAQIAEAAADAGSSHIIASTYKAKPDSFRRLTAKLLELKDDLYSIYWEKGEKVGRTWYMPSNTRRKILSDLRDTSEGGGMTFASCREGFRELQSSEACDGTHLIPA